MTKKRKIRGIGGGRTLPTFTPKDKGLRDALVRALVKSIWPNIIANLGDDVMFTTPIGEELLQIAVVAAATSSWELCESIHADDINVAQEHMAQFRANCDQAATELIAELGALSNPPKETVQ